MRHSSDRPPARETRSAASSHHGETRRAIGSTTRMRTPRTADSTSCVSTRRRTSADSSLRTYAATTASPASSGGRRAASPSRARPRTPSCSYVQFASATAHGWRSIPRTGGRRPAGPTRRRRRRFHSRDRRSPAADHGGRRCAHHRMHREQMQWRIEQGEGCALTRAVERRPNRRAAPLDVRGRKCPKRPGDFGKSKVGEMSPLQCREPALEELGIRECHRSAILNRKPAFVNGMRHPDWDSGIGEEHVLSRAIRRNSHPHQQGPDAEDAPDG